MSALAGALVSLSAAQAGGVSVSGNWELSYTNLDNDEVTGNKLGMNKNISFGASGDITSGGGVTWTSSIAATDALGLSSAYMTLNFGDIMTMTYDSGDGSWGANAVDNIVPTAWEEIDAGFSTGIIDVGAVSKSKGVYNMTITAPGSGTGLSFSYVPRMGGDHVADGATGGATGDGYGADLRFDLVNVSYSQFGWRLGAAAEMQHKRESCEEQRRVIGRVGTLHSCDKGSTSVFYGNPYAGTGYTSLRIGPISAGFQMSYSEPQETANNATSIQEKYGYVGGVALTVGSYMSVSYGRGTDRYRYNDHARAGGEFVNANFSGWSAAVNAGPVALKVMDNRVVNMGGKQEARDSNDHHREVNLSIAF